MIRDNRRGFPPRYRCWRLGYEPHGSGEPPWSTVIDCEGKWRHLGLGLRLYWLVDRDARPPQLTGRVVG